MKLALLVLSVGSAITLAGCGSHGCLTKNDLIYRVHELEHAPGHSEKEIAHFRNGLHHMGFSSWSQNVRLTNLLANRYVVVGIMFQSLELKGREGVIQVGDFGDVVVASWQKAGERPEMFVGAFDKSGHSGGDLNLIPP